MSEDAGNETGTPHVAVVGGGLSGLIAAHRLQQSGLRVSVLESGPRAGGRFSVEVLEGLVYHPSYPVLAGAAPALSGLLDQLDCADRVRRSELAGFRLWTRGGVRRVRTRTKGAQSPLTAWRRARVRRVQDDFSGLLRSSRPDGGTRLDDRSIDQFLSLYLGRRRAAVDGALLEAGLGLDAKETSRQLLMSRLDGWGDFVPSEVSGLGPFVRALIEQIHDLRTHDRVTKIAKDGRSLTLESGETLDCDATLLATRADQALRLTPEPTPAEELALGAIRYRRRMNIVAAVERDEPHATFFTSPDVSSPLAGVSDITPENPPAGSAVRLLMLVARPEFARSLWQDSDVNLCNTLLNRVAGPRSALRRNVRALAVHRLDAESPTYAVGHYRAISRLTQSASQRFEERRLLFCGDYLISPDLEGCAVAALRAADELSLRLRSARQSAA